LKLLKSYQKISEFSLFSKSYFIIVHTNQKKNLKKEKKMNPVSEIIERSFTGTNALEIRNNERRSLAIVECSSM
jgi:hypothetical protein